MKSSEEKKARDESAAAGLWEGEGPEPLTGRQEDVFRRLRREDPMRANQARWHWSRGEEAPLHVSTALSDGVRADYDRANDEAAGRPPRQFAGLRNRAMQRLLNAGEAIDVSSYPRKEGGAYHLEGFAEEDITGMDLCNAETERWIRSVGLHKETGHIFASHSGEFYQNPAFRCIWLR